MVLATYSISIKSRVDTFPEVFIMADSNLNPESRMEPKGWI